MSQVMIQFRFEAGTPGLEDAAAALGLDPADLDPAFGVIATDPDNHLHAVRVDAETARRAKLPGAGDGAEGIFSDPRIAPFGPPED